ncbi:gamma-glutamyl AIG2-like cyclotransferase [Paraburkholderia unamae]|uniref:gamma-glutamylcyclotransferase family protein n=1 Tax=Paraburkholderia unamae TaxID=219649 RepID=UPI000DC347F3|nr:gamma-glutamylcyclotransferase family protein [Paraburkholderia unamae]RAR52292.1 gamma-glutamyl AIG2-like cyclotransferase [Paraburkholderia unamae]
MLTVDSTSFEYLFSYGTLQLEQVQLATFGRKLDGQADEMPGYSLTMLKIDDPAVVATSGKTHHPVVAYTGNASQRVAGTVFAITAEELAHADEYEVDDYRRDRVTLASGISAWVYVDATSPRQA